MNGGHLSRLLVGAAGGQKGKLWEGRVIERLDTNAMSQFKMALGDSRSGPMIEVTGSLRVAIIPHKMVPLVKTNFTARGVLDFVHTCCLKIFLVPFRILQMNFGNGQGTARSAVHKLQTTTLHKGIFPSNVAKKLSHYI